MSRNFVFRPLVAFPRPYLTAIRQNSRFRADVSQTLTLLDFELEKIKAKNTVVQVGKNSDDFRNDGTPRTKGVAAPVVLSFERDGKAVTMPCDAFGDWRDNLRAIALSLEALRAVDRYGVTQRGEQYVGWEALPAPQTQNESEHFDSAADALQWLSEVTHSDWSFLQPSKEEVKKAYQIAAYNLHPDRGGDPAQFRRLQNAKKILEALPQ